MLIAAAEWWRGPIDTPVVFATFGAGLNWGALLACPIQSQGEAAKRIS